MTVFVSACEVVYIDGAITEPPVTVKFVGTDLLLFVPVRVTV